MKPVFNVILFITVFLLCSCSRNSVSSTTFNTALWQDTSLIISDYFETDKQLSQGWLYMGPYFVQFGNSSKDIRKIKNTIKEESNDMFRFSICKDTLCAYAESTSYFKIKKRQGVNLPDEAASGGSIGENLALSVVSATIHALTSQPKVKSENLSGLIYFGIQPAMYFQIDRVGKRNGYGFFRISNNQIISIRPIKKNTGYGREQSAVALEFTIDNQVIGSFIQSDGIIRVALKRDLENKTKLILTALSMALITRPNEVFS